MQNRIDLTKIPVKATVTKTIKANFEGKEKEYKIRALSDGEKFNFKNLMVDGDVRRSSNIYIHLLSCGLGIQPQVAAFLFDNVNEEAIRVGDIIFELSKLFDESKEEEAEVAEKNSVAGTESAPK
jgi:hypothetical protein